MDIGLKSVDFKCGNFQRMVETIIRNHDGYWEQETFSVTKKTHSLIPSGVEQSLGDDMH